VRIAAFTHVSNVLGTINPVAEMTARARAAGALSLVDGAQAVPHMAVDMQELGADFYAWTGHKALGPTGIGVLHGRREILEEMEPFLTGGDMISSVDFQGATWNELPWKFEAGTPPIAEAVGLGAAVDYLSAIGLDAVRAHEIELTGYAMRTLKDRYGDDLTIFGPDDPRQRGGVLSFAYKGIHPHDLSQILDQSGVCIRAGHHCAKPLMRRLGVGATARASFYLYNDEADVDVLADALLDADRLFS
jgi:cysteine desulfurase/selenocysteine lyase